MHDTPDFCLFPLPRFSDAFRSYFDDGNDLEIGSNVVSYSPLTKNVSGFIKIIKVRGREIKTLNLAEVQDLLSQTAQPEDKADVNNRIYYPSRDVPEAIWKDLRLLRVDYTHRDDGMSSLLWAAHIGDRVGIKRLVSSGANVNHQLKNGNTVLMETIAGNPDTRLACVETLLDHGATVNMQNEVGHTAFTAAISIGDAAVVKLLFVRSKAFIDIDHKTKHGSSALMLAIAGNHREVVQCLLDRGVDLLQEDKEHLTAVCWAQMLSPSLAGLLSLRLGMENKLIDFIRRRVELLQARHENMAEIFGLFYHLTFLLLNFRVARRVLIRDGVLRKITFNSVWDTLNLEDRGLQEKSFYQILPWFVALGCGMMSGEHYPVQYFATKGAEQLYFGEVNDLLASAMDEQEIFMIHSLLVPLLSREAGRQLIVNKGFKYRNILDLFTDLDEVLADRAGDVFKCFLHHMNAQLEQYTLKHWRTFLGDEAVKEVVGAPAMTTAARLKTVYVHFEVLREKAREIKARFEQEDEEIRLAKEQEMLKLERSRAKKTRKRERRRVFFYNARQDAAQIDREMCFAMKAENKSAQADISRNQFTSGVVSNVVGCKLESFSDADFRKKSEATNQPNTTEYVTDKPAGPQKTANNRTYTEQVDRKNTASNKGISKSVREITRSLYKKAVYAIYNNDLSKRNQDQNETNSQSTPKLVKQTSFGTSFITSNKRADKVGASTKGRETLSPPLCPRQIEETAKSDNKTEKTVDLLDEDSTRNCKQKTSASNEATNNKTATNLTPPTAPRNKAQEKDLLRKELLREPKPRETIDEENGNKTVKSKKSPPKGKTLDEKQALRKPVVEDLGSDSEEVIQQIEDDYLLAVDLQTKLDAGIDMVQVKGDMRNNNTQMREGMKPAPQEEKHNSETIRQSTGPSDHQRKNMKNAEPTARKDARNYKRPLNTLNEQKEAIRGKNSEINVNEAVKKSLNQRCKSATETMASCSAMPNVPKNAVYVEELENESRKAVHVTKSDQDIPAHAGIHSMETKKLVPPASVAANIMKSAGDGVSIQHAQKKKPNEATEILIPWQKRSQRWSHLLEKLISLPSSKREKAGAIHFSFVEESLYIAKGSEGTVVSVGIRDDGMEVAVKRMLKSHSRFIHNELKNLRLPQLENGNFVQYKDYAEDSHFGYLALELCEYTLDEYIVKLQKENKMHLHAKRLVRELFQGLKTLHEANVLHRDLKPRNVLIDIRGTLKLADFGVSKKMSDNESTIYQTSAMGTRCWRPTETLRSLQKGLIVPYRKTSDIQVAGMITYFIVSGGKHPYGQDPAECEINIRDSKPVALVDEKDDVLLGLLAGTLHFDPSKRRTAEQCLLHPYFWSIERKFEFLQKVKKTSEIRLKVPCKMTKILNTARDWIGCQNWRDQQDRFHMGQMQYHGFVYTDTVVDFLSFVVDTDDMFSEMPVHLQTLIGDPRKHFLTAYPRLFMAVFEIVRDSDWKERRLLVDFFRPQKEDY